MPFRPPSDVWLDPRLVVAPSSIHGLGLCFAADVAAGTVVIKLGGRVVSTNELHTLIAAAVADPAVPYVDTITVFDDTHLVLPSNTPAHYGNHCCDPTLWHVDPFSLATRRAVRASEEATMDYGTQSGAAGFRMACNCGAVACRGAVTSDDWNDPALQRRYAGHWVPALQARIASS